MRIVSSLTILVLFLSALTLSGQVNTQIYTSPNGDMFLQQLNRQIPGSARQWVTSAGGSVRLMVDPVTQASTFWFLPLIGPPIALIRDGDPRLNGETLVAFLRLRPDGLYFKTYNAETDANYASYAHCYKIELATGKLTQFPNNFKTPIVVKRLDGSTVTGKPWFSSMVLPSKDGTELLQMVGLVDSSKTAPTTLDVKYQMLIRVDITPFQETNTIVNSFVIPPKGATIAWQFDFSQDANGGVNFLTTQGGMGIYTSILHVYKDGTNKYLISNGGYTAGELIPNWTSSYQDPLDPITEDYIVTYPGPGGFGRVTRMVGDQPTILAKGEDYAPQVMGFGYPSYNAPYMSTNLGLGSTESEGVLNKQGQLSTFGLARKLPDGSSSAWIGQIAAPDGCGTEFYQSGLDSIPTAEWRAFKQCVTAPMTPFTTGQPAVFTGHNLVSPDPTLMTTLVDVSSGKSIGPCTGIVDTQISCATPSLSGTYQVAVQVGSQVQSDPFQIVVTGSPHPRLPPIHLPRDPILHTRSLPGGPSGSQ